MELIRNIIKEYLYESKKEVSNHTVGEGDIFQLRDYDQRLIKVVSIVCDEEPSTQTYSTQDWGKITMNNTGCNVRFIVSTNNGETWNDPEDNSSVDVTWVYHLLKDGYWKLFLKNENLFDKLNEGYWDELYKSKRYTQKFEIGDRVLMNGTVGDKTFNNELGTILKYKFTGGGTGHPHRVYLILFDNWNQKERNFLMSPVQADQNREFIDSRCSKGSCWYTTSDNLEPAPDSNELFDKLNESMQSTYPVDKGTALYCHTGMEPLYTEGKYYTVTSYHPRTENYRYDTIHIKDNFGHGGSFSVQKDGQSLNYENWFTVGDTGFDTSEAFSSLYESEDSLAWAEDILKEPIKYPHVGGVYRAADIDGYIIDVLITKIENGVVYDITKATIDYDETNIPDDEIDEFLEDYNRTDKTDFSHVEGLILNNHWKPIRKEDSLFSDEKINESEEDEFEWAEDIVKNINDYTSVKWIKTADGKRFGYLRNAIEGKDFFSVFSGWGRWHLVTGLRDVDGVLCYLTELKEDEKHHRGYENGTVYYTPVIDYDENEISFQEREPST